MNWLTYLLRLLLALLFLMGCLALSGIILGAAIEIFVRVNLWLGGYWGMEYGWRLR